MKRYGLKWRLDVSANFRHRLRQTLKAIRAHNWPALRVERSLWRVWLRYTVRGGW